MTTNPIASALLGLMLTVSAPLVQAGVLTFDSRAAFNAQGNIAFNSNFDDFGRGYHFPGYGYTRGDVSYLSEENLIIGAGTPYSVGASRPVMSNEYWSPLEARIADATAYTLLGFDAAATRGVVSITVETNQGSYRFNDVPLPDGSSTFAFFGFRTDQLNEYFTGFRIETQGVGYLAGITGVAVGTASAVPAPPSIALLLAGLGLIAARRRRRD
eukprot:gene33081-40825_t